MLKTILTVLTGIVGVLAALGVIDPTQADSISQTIEMTLTQVAGAAAALVALFLMIKGMFRKDK